MRKRRKLPGDRLRNLISRRSAYRSEDGANVIFGEPIDADSAGLCGMRDCPFEATYALRPAYVFPNPVLKRDSIGMVFIEKVFDLDH